MSNNTLSDFVPAFQASVISLFPDMFPGPLGHSLAGRALQDNIWSLNVITPRSFAVGKHNDVDDPPFGGGHGMVMRPDVMSAALTSLEDAPGPRIYLSPRGKKLTQSMVRDFSQEPGLVMVCGRYEGLDQRAIDKHNLLEVSVGDYILSGGELAALVLLDSIVRLLPGVWARKLAIMRKVLRMGCWNIPITPSLVISMALSLLMFCCQVTIPTSRLGAWPSQRRLHERGAPIYGPVTKIKIRLQRHKMMWSQT